VEIDIIYKYYAPEERLADATTIATATMDVEVNEIWTTLHPVGEVISVRVDDPEEYEEKTKEYLVVERGTVHAPIGDSGYWVAAVIAFVTDP
jgi:hypothetical protein